MKEIADKIGTLYLEMVQKNKELEGKLAEANVTLARATNTLQLLDARAKDLDVREAEIKKVEDVVALQKEVTRGFAHLKDAKEEHLTQVQGIKDFDARVKAENAAQKRENADRAATLAMQAKGLSEGLMKLEEDRKNMRKEIAAEIRQRFE